MHGTGCSTVHSAAPAFMQTLAFTKAQVQNPLAFQHMQVVHRPASLRAAHIGITHCVLDNPFQQPCAVAAKGFTMKRAASATLG